MSTQECWILCCECGTAIQPNSANMCLPCLRKRVDITESIPKQMSIQFCRNCERYLQPPDHWVSCTLESRELLGLCLKKLKGLSKVHLVNASFLWTEPHSKRLKIKLVIQKEVLTTTLLEQAFILEVIVSNQQCSDCAKIMAKNTWQSVVQVRQKVEHKKTLLYLEQLILKYKVHKNVTNIKNRHDGLDFYFQQRQHAIQFADFISCTLPSRQKTSEQLISTDIHSGSSLYKNTFSVELSPICKDDLICLPLKLARSLGNISQLCLCSKIANVIHLIDPMTLQTAELGASAYWKFSFPSLSSIKSTISFVVLDIEAINDSSNRYVLSDAQVIRQSDLGRNDIIFHTRTHLKYINTGDIVLGYDLTSANYNHQEYDTLDHSMIPDVILVKKNYEDKRKSRNWKLHHLKKDDDTDSIMTDDNRNAKRMDREKEREQEDIEQFMQEIEQDPEFRSNILLFKNPNVVNDESFESSSQMDIAELLDDLDISDQDDYSMAE